MFSSSPSSLQFISDNSGTVHALRQKRIELQSIAAKCFAEISKIDNALSALNEIPPQRLNWTKEIMRCFESFPQPQKTTAILNYIFSDNLHELDNPQKRRLYITGLSVALMNLVKKGVLKSVAIPGEKGRLYMIKEQLSVKTTKAVNKLKVV